MPTPAQVANRRQDPPAERHYTATVVAAGPPVMVALDPGGAQVAARALVGATYSNGQRVLILRTKFGNYVLGRIA